MTYVDRPLVSFVRSDLLYDRPEIAAKLGRPDVVTTEMTVGLYDENFDRAAGMFVNATLRYGSMFASSGGHWTETALTVRRNYYSPLR